jgi:hypothetical protein
MSANSLKRKMRSAKSALGCCYTTFASGNSSFIREAVVPLASTLEIYLPSEGIQIYNQALPKPLQMGEQVMNDYVVLAGIVGIFLFVSSRFAGKILDDIYSAKIQPKVTEILDRADKELTGANRQKKKVFQFGVWHTKHRVLILVAIIGDNFDEILKQQDLLLSLHSSGIAWVTKNGSQKPIHVYRLQDGQANVAPLLFDSLMQAEKYLGNG